MEQSLARELEQLRRRLDAVSAGKETLHDHELIELCPRFTKM